MDNKTSVPTTPLVVDQRLRALALVVLRASPRRLCFHCGRPLTAGVCSECDR